MIAGRFSQCQFIQSVIRRLKIAENKANNVVFSTNSVKVDSCAIPKSTSCNRFFSTDQDGSSKLKMAAAANPSGVKHENSLSKEKSPYLLQHARNPVEWYPWGEEAFEKAKREDKLIFLSVGYSTCHWCHVMERESFENEAVAEIMNKHFVNIKVDREERPDVDKVYMTFVQASSGSGGWPMSVFLTPDLKPVAGGTYFPPEDNWGRPGFKSILLNMAKQWKDDKRKLSNTGSKIADLLQKTMIFDVDMAESLVSGQIPPPECWERCVKQLMNHYEPVYGGFGLAPKFPQPSNLMFAFHAYARQPNSPKYEELKNMCLHTLTMMAKGGIHDHVAQGFARYSTDERWHVPHFEKMLYDQGQLAVIYCYAYCVTKDEMYADVVHDILTYVSRDLSHPEGGFYSAEDADSYPTADATEKREGAFCVWTYERVQELLNQPTSSKPEVNLADVFCYHYGIKAGGNVDPHQDPHHELTNQNVLIVNGSEDATAKKFGLEKQSLKEEMAKGRQILYEARQKRPRPHLDNKIITSWNGLMISGYARASETLNNSSYTKRAVQAAEFIKKHLYKPDEKILLRSCYTGENNQVTQISHPIHGFLDDYAFLIRGLLDLYEACFDTRWIEWAEALQEKQDELFWDIASAGYFSTPSSDVLMLRLKEGVTNSCWPYFSCFQGWFSLYTSIQSLKITPSKVFHPKHPKTSNTVLHNSSVEDQDGAEPSGNSIAAQNLLRLSAILERPELRDKAGQLLASFTGRLTQMPVTLPELTSSLMVYHDSPTQIVITGKPSDADTASMLSVVRSRLIAGRVLMLADGDTSSIVYRKSETVSKMTPNAGGHQSAYVCRRHTCTLPVHTAADLASLLDQLQK